MIGLEYILKIYNVSQQQVAELLGIKQQNIDKWVRGIKKIPIKHLPKLSKIFNVSEEYFQKELTKLDKNELSRIQILNSPECREYEKVGMNDDGEEVKETFFMDEGIDFTSLKMLEVEKEILLIQENVQKNIEHKLINTPEHFYSNVAILYKLFNSLISNNCIREDIIEEILHSMIDCKNCKNTKNEFGKVIAELIQKEQLKRNKEDKIKYQQEQKDLLDEEIRIYEDEQKPISEEERKKDEMLRNLFG